MGFNLLITKYSYKPFEVLETKYIHMNSQENGKVAMVGLDDYIDAERSINLEGFTNLTKGISPTAFNAEFPEIQFLRIDKGGMQRLAADIEAKANELSKGGEKQKKRANILIKGAELINSFQRVSVKEDGELKEYWVLEKSLDDQLNSALEKGVLSDALSYGGELSKGKFKKTGKEIKTKLQEIIREGKAKCDAYSNERDELQKKIGVEPSEKLESWDKRGLNSVDHLKKYPWNMCRYTDNSSDSYAAKEIVAGAGSISENSSTDENSAKNCAAYNRNVYDTLSCMKDLSAAETFERNINEKQTYELSFSELKALNF